LPGRFDGFPGAGFLCGILWSNDRLQTFHRPLTECYDNNVTRMAGVRPCPDNPGCNPVRIWHAIPGISKEIFDYSQGKTATGDARFVRIKDP
jgi:hypothetical protein